MRWPLVILLLALGVAAILRRGRGDFSAVPKEYQPHRPLAIDAINGLGGYYSDLSGGTLLPSVEEAIAEACSAAKLPPGATCTADLPGESEWREGLARLLASYEADAKLTTLGQIIAKGHLEQWLVTRIRLIHAWNALPAGVLATEPIRAPVFIVGWVRTGTTFLHQLMMQDPALRAPLHWELVEPIPAHGVRRGDPEAHVAAIQAKLDQFTQLAPGMNKWHPMSATMAEECVVTFSHEFASMQFGVTFNASAYNTWVMGRQDHTHLMRWHRRLLQYLQREEQLAADDAAAKGGEQPSPRRTWLLKTPQYQGMLDDVLRAYPDAKIIQTHRPPGETLASYASVQARMWGVSSNAIDLHRIGAYVSGIASQTLARGMASRERDEQLDRSVVDVQLTDLKKDPMGTVSRLYSALGMELTAEAQAAMEAWLEKKQVFHGAHKPRLADFGLSKESVMTDPTFSATASASMSHAKCE